MDSVDGVSTGKREVGKVRGGDSEWITPSLVRVVRSSYFTTGVQKPLKGLNKRVKLCCLQIKSLRCLPSAEWTIR